MVGVRDNTTEKVLVHATALAIGTRGVIIRGQPGAGKSDLALRCLTRNPADLWGEPVRLISDDRVIITRTGTTLSLSAPSALLGKLEVRGVGIVDLPTACLATTSIPLNLIVDLTTSHREVVRLPEPTWTDLLGISVQRLILYPFEASAPIKVALAVTYPAQATV